VGIVGQNTPGMVHGPSPRGAVILNVDTLAVGELGVKIGAVRTNGYIPDHLSLIDPYRCRIGACSYQQVVVVQYVDVLDFTAANGTPSIANPDPDGSNCMTGCICSGAARPDLGGVSGIISGKSARVITVPSPNNSTGIPASDARAKLLSLDIDGCGRPGPDTSSTGPCITSVSDS